ncbi:MAG: hypothetical protein HUK02_05420, partial [Bacteroidaceae bacterium]|nr:hypothetical protein [Bacteroidaceae bacterium]
SFSAARPMQDLELTLQFDAPALASLNGTYVLSTLTTEQRSTLAQYGVVLPEAGTTTGSVDLRSVIPAIYNQGHDTSSPVTLRVKANNRWGGKTVTMVVTRPVYTMHKQAEGNAWSKSIYIDPVAAEDVATDIEGLGAKVAKHMSYQISSDGGATWADIATPVTDGKPMASGRSVDSDYMIRGCIAGTNIYSTDASTYHTEAEVAVPNGDFESLTEKIAITDLTMGGLYEVSVAFFIYSYQNTLSFTISEPVGWGTINHITCNYNGAANKNSWFVVPSTFNTNCYAKMYQDFGVGVEGTTHTEADHFANKTAQHGANAMVLQNVAWSLNGNTPDKSGGQFSTTYYCKNAPTNVNYTRSAGQLFLQDEVGEGNAYGTRPTVLSFYYLYGNQKDAAERGYAEVELLAGDDVIGTGTSLLSAQGSYTLASVPITYSIIDRKATRLRIKFKSSNASNITTADVTGWEQCSYGASLQVDNLTFTYGK